MNNSRLQNAPLALYLLFLMGLVMVSPVAAADDPDDLYRKGRFAEAEKGYAQLDMDHPKDFRYRYNRGCAAYQNSDYRAALGAFSSVLKRATDDEVRFNTLYNLGNIAYKLRDFSSAVAYYEQAIICNPSNKDVRHNLELALREREKQKDSREHQGDHGSDQTEGEKTQKKPEAVQSQSDKQTPQKKPPEEGSSQGPAEEDPTKHDESQENVGVAGQESRKSEQDHPTDLSGNLQSQAMPEKPEGSSESAMATISKAKAEALLENIEEDRSKYLRFQLPPEKRDGVQSGKEW